MTGVQLLDAAGTKAWAFANPAASEQSRARLRLPAGVVHAVTSCNVIVFVQVLLQLALVTVRDRVTGLVQAEPAVTVTVCPLVDPTIVPLVMLQE